MAETTLLRNLIIATVLGFLFFTNPSAISSGQAQTFATKAKQAIIMDALTGAILFGKNENQLMAPASMSKLMTMTLIFEAIKSRQLAMDDEFLITENAFKRGGSRMFAKLGSSISLENLIQGVIVQSANDASVALAEGMSGTEVEFAKAMTKRARELGLEKSTFINATGWPDPKQRMTARELALLARHIIYKLSDFYRFYSQSDFTWNKITQKNRNPLLGGTNGVDGLKTGFTEEAGYGLVASARRKGRRLILVVNGLETKSDRKTEARKLLDWGFRSFRNLTLFEEGETVGQARVWGGDSFFVGLVSRQPISILSNAKIKQKISAEIVYTGPIQAPVREGQKIGFLRIKSGGLVAQEIALFALRSVERGSFLKRAIGAALHLSQLPR
jgi:serine-type D-Ala-D-Ala carboxypeptidase (penicillin-binding protein 5/6)